MQEIRICRHAIVRNSRLSKKGKARGKAGILNDYRSRLDRIRLIFVILTNKLIQGEIH